MNKQTPTWWHITPSLFLLNDYFLLFYFQNSQIYSHVLRYKVAEIVYASHSPIICDFLNLILNDLSERKQIN